MKLFRQFELALARVGLIAIVIIILAGGVGRAVGHPLIWSLEIAMVIFAWVSMFAIDYAFQSRRHIGIDAVVNLFPQELKIIFLWGNEIVILGFLFCGVWYGFNFVITTHLQVLPVTELSLAWLNSAVPTGCLLMCITSLDFLFSGCQEKQQKNEVEICS